MVVLDYRLRSILENNIDEIMNNPDKSMKAFNLILKESGIEPNLESVLSTIVGYIYGLADLWYIIHYQKNIPDDEFAEITKLMKRRALEMREAFISTHLEK